MQELPLELSYPYRLGQTIGQIRRLYHNHNLSPEVKEILKAILDNDKEADRQRSIFMDGLSK